MAAAKRTEMIHEIIALLQATQIESAKKKLAKMVSKRSERAPSAYNLFVGHAIKVDKMEMKEAVAAWGSMSDKDKEKWVKQAQNAKAAVNPVVADEEKEPKAAKKAGKKKPVAEPEPEDSEDETESEEEPEPVPVPKKKAAAKKSK